MVVSTAISGMRLKTLHNSMSGLLSTWGLLLAAGLSVLLLSACAVAPSADIAGSAAAGLPDTELAAYASAPRLDFSAATVLLDNDEAFEQKLQAVRNARKSLDLAYYIFVDDYSSSLLAQELIAAKARGEGQGLAGLFQQLSAPRSVSTPAA